MPGSQVLKTEPNYESPQRQSRDVRSSASGSHSNSFKRKVALAIWFAVAFGLSYLLVVACGSLLVRKESSLALESDDGGRDTVVQDALVVANGGTALRVAHHSALNPSGKDDFLFYIWFKLRKPLVDGERAVFVAKFDPDSKIRPGYSMSLVGGPDGVRPHIYWQSEQGQGRWYPFASTQLRAKEWYVLAVSFREERYLGVHLMMHNGGKKPEVLGGYDLEQQVIPENQADLLVGAFGVSKFRGRIGPFGVIRRPGMTKDVATFVAEMSKEPGILPSEISSSDAVLAASPKQDSGPLKLVIRPSGNSGGPRAQGRNQGGQ
jgi:hypothetical protein